MAELDEPGDEPNFDLFGSFGLDELLLIETDSTEQTEQTEIGQLNDEDIDNFITENRNKNTTKKTQSDLNVFYRWAKSVNETRTLENISEQELDKLLAHFVLNARKQNGDEYEPDTLTSMLRSFDRLLRKKENITVYSLTDSSRRPEKLCLANESSFAVLAKGKSRTKRLD